MTQNITNSYAHAIKSIKQAILRSRYQAALLANREMLMLYFSIGEYISKNSREGKWGTNAIEVISNQLQKELPGLRGFSATNLKNMRLFFEAWQNAIPDATNRQLPTDDLQNQFHLIPSNQLQNSYNEPVVDEIIIRQIPSDELDTNQVLNRFVSIGFTHHITIINNAQEEKERLFYVEQCATGFWSVEKLKYNLKI